ncbi:hypothetical protein [Devosia sp.]|uniref:hypothetical protein n=1 Tax=Devosia sp. TaxID=1871048 RepID=UPI003A925957
MSIGRIMELYQFAWMFESHAQQRLAWDDAADARFARMRAEQEASRQLQMMLEANPSGSLGHATLDDEDVLKDSGLL